MVVCKFCNKEFSDKHDLHLHWDNEHSHKLSSHDQSKVKKAFRKEEDKKHAAQDKRKRKVRRRMGWAAFFATLMVIGYVGIQLFEPSQQQPVTQLVNVSGQPSVGNSSASIEVVEFGDYKCPYCAQWHEQVYPQLKQEYIDTGKVEFHFINYPFLGEDSTTGALAGECVYNQSNEQFWKFHEHMYENQGSETDEWITLDAVTGFVRESTTGVDSQQLRKCVDTGKLQNVVSDDKDLGREAGVTGTPEVYVNGEKVGNAMDYREIKELIENQ